MHKDNKNGSHHGHMVAEFRRRFWVSFALSLPVLALSPVVQEFLNIKVAFTGSELAAFGIAGFIFVYGGWPFLSGLKDELSKKQPGMMTLVGVAITVAFGYSAAVVFGLQGKQLLWELVTLIDVMLLGHWIEMRSVMGASRALEELAKLLPDTVHKVDKEAKVVDVSLTEIKKGDVILVKPGEKIPADGIVRKGASSVSEALLTGESKPVEKKEGDEVIGGSINAEGSLTIEVKHTGESSYIEQVISLVKKAQESKSKTQNLANKAAMWLTVVALAGGTLTLSVWLIFTGSEFAFAFERAISVVVIACPHALGLAIPLVVAVSTSVSARNGLLVRNRDAFEAARHIDTVIFDKTGTLTEGIFEVSDVVSTGSWGERDILEYAAAVEQYSEHPIAKAISDGTKNILQADNFSAIPGKGARAKVQGKTVEVVSASYLKENKISFNNAAVDELLSSGKTVSFVVVGGVVVGAVGLDDVVRAEARSAIDKLKDAGVKTAMLTGDNEAVAARVAKELGIGDYFAQVLPDKKAEKVKELQNSGVKVAFVGDGINDAPALAQADLGIAIGAGTDIAAESADVVLVRNNPEDAVKILELAKKTYNKMVQNLWWASGYNIVALPLAAGVLYGAGIVISPAMGAVFMSASTVIVAFNATTLIRR